MTKKLYHVQTRDRRYDPDGSFPWYSPIEGQFVSLEFAKGYMACSQSYYPSPDIRLVDAKTKEIIEERDGNSKVSVN